MVGLIIFVVVMLGKMVVATVLVITAGTTGAQFGQSPEETTFTVFTLGQAEEQSSLLITTVISPPCLIT